MKPKKRLVKKWWKQFGKRSTKIDYDIYCMHRLHEFFFHTSSYEEDALKIKRLFKWRRE